ncbi:zinc finger protein with KRAB and SCAN domains 1-like [Pungitius pungitius]|uniref:zinc finger protein with KRAB and SCAN domains 1-like n=1 Tax=Pungitius pungitius TaxID=134920 RepID=UPI002E10CF6D
MESARSAFHAQLAAVMDSLLAAAVCEIAKIFESSLCEQQAQLAHKTDEICVLRGKLEKVDRRHKAKGGGEGSEEVEVSPGDREGALRQQTLAGSERIHLLSNRVDGLRQSLSGLKEEVTVQSDVSIKHERAVSRPSPGFIAGQVPDESLAAGDLRHIDTLPGTQAKAKLSHWDQDSDEHRSLQDQASIPFISISQSGRCSPRPDPSLTQPADWLPGLNATRGGLSGLENLQMDGTGCSGPASSSTGTDGSCFRPGFVSDETSNEEEDGGGSFPFLDQEPENQDSNQNVAQGHSGGLRGTRQVQPQAPSAEPSWRPRDDRGERGSINHTRRLTTFGSRDPLRPQSNALRHTNALSHPAAPSGGSGRPYTCPYCTKCFTYPSHQRRHLLRHTGVRLHPCQFCDKSFLTPSELTVHTRTHTGERPFGCAQCGKRFARSGNLRAHQRDVHMGKRPFACGECGKRFAHRGNLRVHNHRVHQGDPYYMEEQQEPDIGPNPI